MSDNRLARSIYHVARLVLQTETPLSIGAGGSHSLYDNLIVRDANGLPAIPGSSLAGVLRALYREAYGQAETDALFGTADRNREKTSRIQVSWGCLHDRNDLPIEGLREPKSLADSDDPLLQDALADAPLRRDHVKLNHRGVADGQAKFDRTGLTAGHRFSVELSLWRDADEEPAWHNLLALLRHPAFRLGGNTRRGLGKIKVVRCAVGCFKLGKHDADGAELARFSRLSQRLAETPNLIRQGLLQADELSEKTTGERIELRLTPEAEGFRFGGLGAPWNDKNSDADASPLIEKQIFWESSSVDPVEQGNIQKKALLFSATGLKGALSHRVAYHYNLLAKVFAEEVEDLGAAAKNNPAARALFGYVPEEKDKKAQVGCLLFDDLYLSGDGIKSVQLPHSGIDRFTGGVRDGVLYFEELILHEQSLPVLTLTLTKPKERFDPKHIEALERALDDLCNGYLALGAGGGRGGYGYFSGTWNWIGE